MNVSNKLLIFFFATYWLQPSNLLFAHGTKPLGVPIEITTSEQLHNALTSPKPTVIMLKMDPCPHCKALMPIIEAAAKNKIYRNVAFYLVQHNRYKLNTVQAVKDASNGAVHVLGFPSILYINKGAIDLQTGGNKKTFEEKLTKLIKTNRS